MKKINIKPKDVQFSKVVTGDIGVYEYTVTKPFNGYYVLIFRKGSEVIYKHRFDSLADLNLHLNNTIEFNNNLNSIVKLYALNKK